MLAAIMGVLALGGSYETPREKRLHSIRVHESESLVASLDSVEAGPLAYALDTLIPGYSTLSGSYYLVLRVREKGTHKILMSWRSPTRTVEMGEVPHLELALPVADLPQDLDSFEVVLDLFEDDWFWQEVTDRLIHGFVGSVRPDLIWPDGLSRPLIHFDPGDDHYARAVFGVIHESKQFGGKFQRYAPHEEVRTSHDHTDGERVELSVQAR